jgi:hypothetical protein
MDEMDRTYSTNGEKRNVYKLLVGKQEGKKPQRNLGSRWMVNIEMNLRKIGRGGMD